MASCHYCGYGEPGHNVACPDSMMTAAAKAVAHKSWEAGYQDGRSGKPMRTDASATYSLGYGRGVVALEEAENGYDPRRFDYPLDSLDEAWDNLATSRRYDDSDDDY